MNYTENYYRTLCEQLQLKIELLEKKIEKEKNKEKTKNKKVKANKDYDGDGKVESGKEEYFGSRDKAIKKNMAKKKDIVDKTEKKKLNEGRVIGGGPFQYGGFPKILNESKKGLPPEMLADLFVKNSTEGYEPEDAAMYTPLPPEIHRQILPHVEDEVLMIGQGGRIPEGANVQKHINDLTKAIRILDNAGHGNHPAAHFLDKIRDHLHYN
jgi:phage anti-repressor protein